MDSILIQGGRPLRGTLSIQGCKNALLPLMAAAAAIPGRVILTACPPIRDKTVTLALLEGLGVTTSSEGDRLMLDASRDGNTAPDPALAGQLRSSVLLLGALLGRYGHAEVPLPGGCLLGARPLDLHLAGLEALGVQSFCDGGILHCRGTPKGGRFHLPFPSVGATENLMLAALGADGPIWITGAAQEPEIEDLAGFLNVCGARISGAGSSRIHIIPAPLHGGSYRVLPDRMEAATWLCAAACTGGSLTLTELRPDHLRPVLRALSAAGCQITEGESTLHIRAGALHSPGAIRTAPYPGFPTDAQAPLMAALLRAEGSTRFDETVFEDRFRHIPALQAMGARISCSGRTALVTGVSTLHGARVAATDLRGAAAMVCAALTARGESEITQAWHLERGYGNFLQRLRLLGAVASAR
ncbi:MAG: UDP-N-acetylglucosamine 1-carboxyvinyltransferase [Oscillospiraceae bacterium]|nr:UDP-N-acetylglucosamine 1-carboxyvinyltransferase [Oscillospiraceae bacterium]